MGDSAQHGPIIYRRAGNDIAETVEQDLSIIPFLRTQFSRSTTAGCATIRRKYSQCGDGRASSLFNPV